MSAKHTISVLVENKFGVLARISSLFSGRGFNIDTLNVGPVHHEGFSRITATIIGDDAALDQALKQLNKLINVIEVEDFIGKDTVFRELILLKVKAETTEVRSEIIQICDIFRAKIVDVAKDSTIIEVTGNPAKIRGFLNLVRPYGIIQMARTGNVALKRGESIE
ncbi:MAG: acetolactate synthase small subunit [Opitutales bacterium]|nr:acetolactate synthase small subunit [Opitutales bacterium]